MINFNNKNFVNRMINVYKLKAIKVSCNHFYLELSSITNRILRNSFSNEYIILCVLETDTGL